MRVVTWNVQHGRRADTGGPDPGALAAACAELGADVLALQEVDRRTRRVGGADLLELVASATGLHPIDGPAMRFADGSYGNALLVHGAPEGASTRLLQPTTSERFPGPEPRSIVWCRLTGVTVAGCHLGLGRRLASAHLRDALGSFPAGPAVLLGDLNLRTGDVDAVLRRLPDWTRADVPPAYPASAPDRAIDHVLVRDVAVVAVDPPDAHRPVVSDHRPVGVELAWPSAT